MELFNRIEKISDEIENLREMKVLNLSTNKIRGNPPNHKTPNK